LLPLVNVDPPQGRFSLTTLGAVTPFCSCSTVPITAGLLKGGVPFGPVMSFLFASPVLNPVTIALVFSLLGYKVTMLYVVVTFLGPMIGAALVEKVMEVGTVLALVIGGAGASIPEMIILGSMFKKKLVFAFVLNVFLVAVAAGYLVDLLIY